LKAFSRSSVTSTLLVCVRLRANHCRVVWTAASHPPGVPTPSCTGSKYSRSFASTLFTSTLPVSRHRVSPTATGRSPPVGFGKATRDAPHNHSWTPSGAWPLAKRLTTCVRWRKTSSRKPGSSASFKCCGRSPLGPAPVPRAKLARALLTASTSACVAAAGATSRSVLRKCASLPLAFGCFDSISWITVCETSAGGAWVSAAHACCNRASCSSSVTL